MTIIELSNLTKKYTNGRGIEKISLQIEKGDIFGFLGPNGSGKTTTMKIMTGLITPDSGVVKILNMDISEHQAQVMRHVGTLIETDHAFEYMTAFENMRQIGRYHKSTRHEIEQIMQMTGILKYQHENVRNFSLGMKQRLGIACAMLGNPQILILDEPLNGLDIEGMLEVRKTILKLASEKGTTFFISSHLIHDLEKICNRVGVLYQGKLVKEDYMTNILSQYATLENYFVSEVDRNANILHSNDK